MWAGPVRTDGPGRAGLLRRADGGDPLCRDRWDFALARARSTPTSMSWDFGCGEGRFLVSLGPRAGRTVGVDHNDGIVRRLAGRGPRHTRFVRSLRRRTRPALRCRHHTPHAGTRARPQGDGPGGGGCLRAGSAADLGSQPRAGVEGGGRAHRPSAPPRHEMGARPAPRPRDAAGLVEDTSDSNRPDLSSAPRSPRSLSAVRGALWPAPPRAAATARRGWRARAREARAPAAGDRYAGAGSTGTRWWPRSDASEASSLPHGARDRRTISRPL